MNPLCYELLNGTLTWNGQGGQFNTTITNNLPVPLSLDYVPNPGTQRPAHVSGFPCVLAPGANHVAYGWSSQTDDDGSALAGYYKATVAASGSLVDVFDVSAATSSVALDFTVLSAPNDIGPIPVPTSSIPGAPVEPQPIPPRPGSTMIIPPDSARVLVGCGTAPNGNSITREQYWGRQNDSICLAGNEKRTVSYTVTSGKQTTSSDTTTMAASLSSSISGGWGPVSASISASLSVTSTSFQQVTVTEQATSYVSNEIHNPHDEPISYFRWQLIDVITVFDKTNGQPISSLVQAENPTVVMGPYWVSQRPLPPSEATARKKGLFEYK